MIGLMRLSAILLILLPVVEVLVPNAKTVLPLGGNHLFQTAIVFSVAYALFELWEHFWRKNDGSEE